MNQSNVVAIGVRSVHSARAAKGKDKVKAGRKPVITEGLGIALLFAMDVVDGTVRDAMLDIMAANTESQKQALAEIQDGRDAKVAELSKGKKTADLPDLTKRKIMSIRAGIQRAVTIVKCVIAGKELSSLKTAPSLAMMYAVASKASVSRGGNTETRTVKGQGFSQWDGKADRVIDKDKSPEAIANMEKHVLHCLAILAKKGIAEQTYLPVAQMLALSKRAKPAPAAKAA